MRLSDENLRGRTVIAADGVAIGEVVGLFLDAESWRVESIRIRLRKEITARLGVDHSVFRPGVLEVPARMVQSVGDAVVLSVMVDGLRSVLPNPEQAEPGPAPH